MTLQRHRTHSTPMTMRPKDTNCGRPLAVPPRLRIPWPCLTYRAYPNERPLSVRALYSNAMMINASRWVGVSERNRLTRHQKLLPLLPAPPGPGRGYPSINISRLMTVAAPLLRRLCQAPRFIHFLGRLPSVTPCLGPSHSLHPALASLMSRPRILL